MSWLADALGRLVRVVWRWKWTYAVPVATCLLAATLFALRQPDTYEASAIVQINEMLSASSGVLPRERDKSSYQWVSQARDRLLTSRNVQALVPVLAPDAAADDLAVLQRLTERIAWDRIGDGAFRISLTDTDPVVGARAVNALADAFLENEKQAKVDEAAQRFAHAQAQRARVEATYERATAALAAYRSSHEEARPGTKEHIDNELEVIRSLLDKHRDRAARWQDEVDVLEQELARGPASPEARKDREQSARERSLAGRLDEQVKRVQEARAELQSLQATKTEAHPKVMAARERVRRLDGVLGEVEAELDAERRQQDAAWRVRREAEWGHTRALKQERLARLNEDVAGAAAEVARLGAKGRALLARLERAPAASDQAAPLIDDKNLAYQALVDAQQLASETEQQALYVRDAPAAAVTPFALIQRAEPPVRPSGPARVRWLLMALIAGALIGYGCMLLQRRFDEGTIHDARDVAGLLPGAMVVAVPRLGPGPRIPAGAVARDVVLGAWVTACLGLSAVAILAHRGAIEAPGWLEGVLGV